MFFRLFKFNIIRTIRSKEMLFWNLLFPIVLGTLFHVTFGGYMDKREIFKEIPVAYVEENAADTEFSGVLDQMEDSDDALVKVTDTSLEQAKEMLADEEIDGIYYNSVDGLKLYVNEDGIKPSILKVILQEYQKSKNTITTIAQSHPEMLEQVINSITEETSILKEEKYTNSNMDAMTSYFYALIAMTCLYGCFMGVGSAVENKADLTPLGTRRVVASTNRFIGMAADISSNLLMQFCCAMFATFYLKYALGIDFGSKMSYLVLVVLIGSFIGIATGFFIGSLGRQPEDAKMGIAVSITMLECFLSGLMVQNMYYIIEEYCPILNRINPAALILDALYSLDIYPTMDRFYQNLAILFGIAVLLCIASFLAVRRERYASL